MKRYLGTFILAITCFALGAAVQRFYDLRRSALPPAVQTAETTVAPTVRPIQFDQEPLWAYGFDTLAKAGDKAAPQAPPTRNLRPNEDPAEQTRPRRVAGSNATYSLVDVRDGQNVIDWFPGDHPCRCRDVIKHGPAACWQHDARMRLVSSAERQGPPGECAAGGTARRVLRAPDPGFSQRPTSHRRSAQAEHEHDDRPGEGDDRRRNAEAARVLRRDQMDAVDPRRRDATSCRRRASSAICFCRLRRNEPSRLPAASSRCRRTRSRPRRYAIRTRLCRVRAARQHQEGRGSCHDRRDENRSATRSFRARRRRASRATASI